MNGSGNGWRRMIVSLPIIHTLRKLQGIIVIFILEKLHSTEISYICSYLMGTLPVIYL